MDSPNQWNRHHWGKSRHLLITEQVDLAEAHGKAGGQSSMHYHRAKANSFIVVEGIVEIWEKPETIIVPTRLSSGQSYTVPSGVPHRMVFSTDAMLYEFYHADDGKALDLGDIVRLDEGRRPTDSSVPRCSTPSGSAQPS